MDFDFHQTYSALSNTELIKILQESNNYQPAAIAAAEQILQSRNITAEEKQEAAMIIAAEKQGKETGLAQRSNLINNIASKISWIGKGEKNTATYIVLGAMGLLLITIFTKFSSIYYNLWLLFRGDPIDFFYFLQFLITTVFFLLGIYWLIKLEKPGWIVLFIFLFFSLAANVNTIINYIPVGFLVESSSKTRLFLTAGFQALLLYYLNRKDVMEVLHVSADTRRYLLIGGLVIIALIYVPLGKVMALLQEGFS